MTEIKKITDALQSGDEKATVHISEVMAEFKCHKLVNAAVIKEVDESNGLCDVSMVIGLPGTDIEIPYIASVDMVSRYTPVAGDYIVLYENNYVSFSPKKAFEDGYSETKELPEKVTFEHIQGVIAEEQYLQPVGTLTICILTLKNGFRVTGESACADPATFNKEDGEKYAKEDAISKVWMLEGYLLKEALYNAGK